jgi:hypothetical protein
MALTDVVAWIGATTGVLSFGHRIWEGATTRSLDEQRRSHDRAARARDHALATHIQIEEWAAVWEGLAKTMDTAEAGLTMAIFAVEEFPRYTAMPATITERLDSLSEFGTAAEAMQKLAYVHTRLVANMPEIRAFVAGNYADEDMIQATKAQCVLLFRSMIEATSEARKQVRILFKMGA